MEIGKLLDGLRIGLSRLLRYSYGGFLLIAAAVIIDRSHTEKIIGALGLKLTVLVALLVGAGIYALHRGVVVPIHHLGLCGLLMIWDLANGRRLPEESRSPTRWLSSLDVRWGERIMAYTALRHSGYFTEDEKQEMNIAHAENGLVLMTFEGLAVATCVCRFQPIMNPYHTIFLWLAVLFFLFPYFRAFADHQRECMRLRTNRRYVIYLLRDQLGFLQPERENGEPAKGPGVRPTPA